MTDTALTTQIEARQKVVNAMRSRKDKPLRQAYRNATRFCAMGLAFKIFMEVNEDKYSWNDRNPCQIIDGIECRIYPSVVCKWIGIDYSDCVTLTSINDAGFDWNHLADKLESFSLPAGTS